MSRRRSYSPPAPPSQHRTLRGPLFLLSRCVSYLAIHRNARLSGIDVATDMASLRKRDFKREKEAAVDERGGEGEEASQVVVDTATAAAARAGHREQALLSETPPPPSQSPSCSFTVRRGDANDVLLHLGLSVANPNPDPAAVAVGDPKLPVAVAAVDGVAAAQDGSGNGGGGGGGDTGASSPGVGGWDFIDVDPFGSCLPFLEAAVASVKDGGVLAVAATDLAVLCGKKGGHQVVFFCFRAGCVLDGCFTVKVERPPCPRTIKTVSRHWKVWGLFVPPNLF